MAKMEMVLVESQAHIRQFLDFPAEIFQHDNNWIRPLDKDIEAVFDSKKNKFFRNGTCKRWLLLDEQKNCIGKVAAFINKKYVAEQPTGGIGFFDCINDQKAANFIFDFCKNWLRQQGMEAMDGPINFGERDKWWGLLVQGFHQPLYGMNYHPPYYKTLFENYGFQVYFNQECFGRKLYAPLQERFSKHHEAIAQNKDYKAKRLKIAQLEKYAEEFSIIYNDAFATHNDGKKISKSAAVKLFNSMKPVIDENIIWFAYYKERPIAFWVNLPDLNQFFKSFDGKFGWWQKVQFLYKKHFVKNPRFVGLVFGVVRDFQGKGVDSFLIVEGANHIRKGNEYEDYEMQWIGDFNPKMINIAKNLDTENTRRLSTYRYLFDQNKTFKRHPTI